MKCSINIKSYFRDSKLLITAKAWANALNFAQSFNILVIQSAFDFINLLKFY